MAEKKDAPIKEAQPTTAVAEKKRSIPAKLVQSGITQYLSAPRTAFLAAGGTEQQFAREINYAVDLLNDNDYLLKCATENPDSLISSIKNVGLSGLTLDPVQKLGYLLPRKGKVYFQASYMGKKELLVRSGVVKDIEAQIVYSDDEFEYEKGLNPVLRHKPKVFAPRQKENIVGGYWIATLVNGTTMFEAVNKDFVNKIMARSESVKSGKSSPWDTDYESMFRKTLINQAFKFLPKTGISESMLKVIGSDNEVDEEDLKDFIKEQETKDTFTEDANFEEAR